MANNHFTFQDKMVKWMSSCVKKLFTFKMTYYSALCVSLLFNEELITKGTVFIGPPGINVSDINDRIRFYS